MFRLMLAVTLVIAFGVIIIVAYNKTFSNNVKKALLDSTDIKMPDLSDVVSTFLLFCVILGFSFSMLNSAKSFRQQVSVCESSAFIDDLQDDIAVCLNQYDNMIFFDQSAAYKYIQSEYGDLMNNLTNERTPVSTDYIDNIYYTLQRSRNNDEEEELYRLLTIYLNYYETEHKELHIGGL